MFPLQVAVGRSPGSKVPSSPYPSGLQLAQAHDGLDALLQIDDGQGALASFTYWGARPKQTTFGNGTTRTDTYGSYRSEVTTVHHQTGAQQTTLQLD
ncbi:MAG: hypothetical protein ACC662_11235 [Planctomycetota bacterium]